MFQQTRINKEVEMTESMYGCNLHSLLGAVIDPNQISVESNYIYYFSIYQLVSLVTEQKGSTLITHKTISLDTVTNSAR
jgi:hypothetical protein